MIGNIPLRRRRQTLAVVIWLMLMPLLVCTFLLLLTRASTAPIAMAYIVFMLFDSAPENGGRKWSFVREWSFWRWFKDFFPLTLVKTCELDPAKNYIFLYHPHGIISLGAFTNFGTEAGGFSKLFPGIDLRLLTLEANFRLPFWRDLILALGICSVSRRSCTNILTKGPGNSLMIVPGGASEALYAFPGTFDLVLKRRLGFVKLALRHGSSLVPVLGFGENDLWDQLPNPKGSIIFRIQKLFQKYASFSPPMFFGRGIFQYSFGIVPYRRPVYTVVGNPIDCPQLSSPTESDVIEYHKRYLEGVQKLYDEYKDSYASKRKTELSFVE